MPTPEASNEKNADDLSSASTHFSPDYQSARQKFLTAADHAGAAMEHHQHPKRGPCDEPLYTDLARLGPKDATEVLMLVSGTHGIEGFTGSAIQTALLRGGVARRLGPDQALLLVHAINPFGFAHRRRVNEDNVDLNRNFPDGFSPPPENQGYERLAGAIAPPSLSGWSELCSRLAFFRFRLRHGRTELQRAVSAGQYTHPEGLFYGGNGPVWSHLLFETIVRKHLGEAGRVVLLDLHTGLGSFGAAEVITVEAPDTPAYRRAQAWWGARLRSTADGSSSSAEVGGTLLHRLPQLLPETEVTAAVLECGTLPPRDVFLALRWENYLWHHGAASDREQVLIPVFYPGKDSWRKAVLAAGLAVVAQGLAGLSSPL